MTEAAVSAEAGNAADATSAAALLSAEASTEGAATVDAAASSDALVTDAEADAWRATLPEAERALAKTKGWAKPDDVFKSYANLEKLVGGDKIPAPKNPDDTEGYERIYKALGKPEAPDGYKLPIPDGSDGEFAKTAAGMFHKAGLGAKQAEVLATEWNALQTAQAAAIEKAHAVKAAQDLGELKTDWGDKYDANLEMGRRAAKQFGLDTPMLEKIERAVGTKPLMTLLNKIGAGLAEDTFEGGGSGSTFKQSPEQARARLDSLKKDTAWQTRFINGGADEKAEWNRLQLLANPQ